MNLYNPGGPRRSGRTTAMVEGVVQRLKTTDGKVFLVVHDTHFESYVKQLLNERLSSKEWKHRVRFVMATSAQIDQQAVHALTVNPNTHMRMIYGIDNADVFVDHVVWE